MVDNLGLTPEVEHEQEGQNGDQETTSGYFGWEGPEIDLSDVGGRDELKSRFWELAIDSVERNNTERTVFRFRMAFSLPVHRGRARVTWRRR